MRNFADCDGGTWRRHMAVSNSKNARAHPRYTSPSAPRIAVVLIVCGRKSEAFVEALAMTQTGRAVRAEARAYSRLVSLAAVESRVFSASSVLYSRRLCSLDPSVSLDCWKTWCGECFPRAFHTLSLMVDRTQVSKPRSQNAESQHIRRLCEYCLKTWAWCN